MPKKVFSWEGYQGTTEKSGMVEAETAEQASDKLARDGIIVTNIEEVEKNNPQEEGAENANQKYNPSKITNKDKVIFTKKMATMIKSGLPIMKVLQMLSEQAENKNMRILARQIKRDVEGVSTLSVAFEQHPKVFDQVYINLLRAGESSGKLTTFLDRLVVNLEKIEKIRRKVKSALMYPIILLSVAIIVILIMLIKVVPVFQQMFSSMGHSLPGPTQLIVDISEFIRDPSKGGMLLLGIVAIFVVVKQAKKKSQSFRERFDRLVLKIPLIGDVIIKSTLSKIAMVSANLSSAGVSVIESLNIISKTVNNIIFLEAFEDIKQGVAKGQNVSKLYSEHEVFPPTFYQMISVGEETGRLDEMLESVALYYEEEFDLVVDRLSELLEPIMIVFMGVTVGFIIIAMYMPIFEIGKVVQG